MVALASATSALDSIGEPAVALGRHGLVLGTNLALPKGYLTMNFISMKAVSCEETETSRQNIGGKSESEPRPRPWHELRASGLTRLRKGLSVERLNRGASAGPARG
jgi:hypothetical protein